MCVATAASAAARNGGGGRRPCEHYLHSEFMMAYSYGLLCDHGAHRNYSESDKTGCNFTVSAFLENGRTNEGKHYWSSIGFNV